MTFVATEGTTQPIVLGKDPVPKPEIHRGSFAFKTVAPPIYHGNKAVTFTTRCPGSPEFMVTYHRAFTPAPPDCEDMVLVIVFAHTVVTWELAGA